MYRAERSYASYFRSTKHGESGRCLSTSSEFLEVSGSWLEKGSGETSVRALFSAAAERKSG